jgi:hypothetical protein
MPHEALNNTSQTQKNIIVQNQNQMPFGDSKCYSPTKKNKKPSPKQHPNTHDSCNNTKHLCQKFNKQKKYKHTQWSALEIHLKSHIKRLYHKHEII